MIIDFIVMYIVSVAMATNYASPITTHYWLHPHFGHTLLCHIIISLVSRYIQLMHLLVVNYYL